MDLLRIGDKNGCFDIDGTNEEIVSQVTDEDIRSAVEVLLGLEDVGIADREDTAAIANPAQRIIFEQLRMAFKEIIDSLESILGEIDSTFASGKAR